MRGVPGFGTPSVLSLQPITRMFNLKRKVMAGVFLMFIVTVLFVEMLDGYLKAQDDTDDTDTPAAIVFTPDDDVREWEDVCKK